MSFSVKSVEKRVADNLKNSIWKIRDTRYHKDEAKENKDHKCE